MRQLSLFLSLCAALVLLAPAPVSAATLRLAGTLHSDDQGRALLRPEGVGCGGAGLLTIADSGNARLLVYRFSDGGFTEVARLDLRDLPRPIAVQPLADGGMLVLDGKLRRLGRIASGVFAGYLDLEGVPEPAVVPRNFRIGPDGTLYLLDLFGHRVLVLDGKGRYRRQLWLPAEARGPEDLAVDDQGRLLVIDAVSRRLYGAGPEDTEFTPLTGSLAGELAFPVSVASDGLGALWLLDKHRGGIGLVGPDGAWQEYKLEAGRSEGMLWYPTQICVEEGSHLVVADQGNNRIQVFEIGR